ncbi:MAG: serine/threonine-protein kinase [Deltaproteobacteria bacterium]
MQSESMQSSDPTRTEEPAREEVLPAHSPGTVIDGRYRIVRSIAAGGMGAVFEAELVSVGRRCALKFLRSELAARPRSAARFGREARLLGKLQHEHLTAVLDYGSHLGESPYLVMEYLEGRTLKQLLAAEGRLPVERALEVILQLARGMAYVHAQQVVHRDLKPENLMLLERSDGRPWVKILDFGIARRLQDTNGQITRSGAELGTAHYMSPEQARGTKLVSSSSDVYAIGAIAYEALSGARVHPGDSYNAVIFQLLTQPHRPLRELARDCPPELASIVERCLEKDASRRYADADSLASALAALPMAQPAATAGCSPASTLRAWARRPFAWRWGAASSVLAAAVVVGPRCVGDERDARGRASAPGSDLAFCIPSPVRETSATPAAPAEPSGPLAASVTQAQTSSGEASLLSGGKLAAAGSSARKSRTQREGTARGQAETAVSRQPVPAGSAEAFPFTANPYGNE